MTLQDDVRVEVTFDGPTVAAPTWRDLSARTVLAAGLTVRRGRTNEYDAIQPGTASCVLENTDGALTPGNSASPYSPNVLPQRRLRITYRDPLAAGNMLAAEDSSFEGGTTGGWANSLLGSPATTLANSTTRADVGTRALLVTWPTAAVRQAFAGVQVTGFVVGRPYTARARVWVPAGAPRVNIGVFFIADGTPTSTTGAWETVTCTFTPNASTHYILLTHADAATAGQQVWVDSVRVDEAVGPAQDGELVTNGDGASGTTNFSWATTDAADKPAGTTASFYRAGAPATYITPTDTGVPYRAGFTYTIGAQFKNKTAGASGRYYFGFALYDVDGLNINPIHYMHQAGTDTTLAADLKPGDTTVTVADGSVLYAGAQAGARYLACWNYVDGQGTVWPVYSYTRNVAQYASVAGNVVTLNAAWSGPTLRAGTPVSSNSSGGTYIYVAQNVASSSAAWAAAGGSLTGFMTPAQQTLNPGSTGAATVSTGAPPATATVRPVFLLNYPDGANPVGNVGVGAVTLRAAAQAAALPIVYKHTGFIDQWPVRWPGAGDTYSTVQLSSVDLLGRLSRGRKLRSVVQETLLADGARWYYPLTDGTSSVSASSAAPGVEVPLVQYVNGSGGTLTWGGGTGVPTDGAASVKFTPNGSFNATILGAEGLPGVGGWLGDYTVECALTTSTQTWEQVPVYALDAYGTGIRICIDTAGKAVARLWWPWGSVGSAAAVTSATSVADSKTHHLAVRAYMNGGAATIELVVDGASQGTAAVTANLGLGSTPFVHRLTVGGTRKTANAFSGVLSHVAVTPAALTVAQLGVHRTAQTTGFAGERSDQRVARVAGWLGLPADQLNLDVGVATVGHIDTSGADPLEYLRKIEATEGGPVFVDGQGRLAMLARTRLYTATATAIVPAALLDGDPTNTLSGAEVVNDVTVKRADGSSVRVTDDTSTSTYGPTSVEVATLSQSPADSRYIAEWRLNMSQPRPRWTTLPVDVLTDAVVGPQLVAGADVGARVDLTGLPAQAPAAAAVQAVQGFTETITADAWTFGLDTTPFVGALVLIADDSTGATLADGPGVAAY